jgi:hypothetical protein
VKPRCAGHSSQTGDPCKLYPVHGSTVCHKHGGRAPQVRAKAQLRLVEQRARELFGKTAPDIVPVDNPLAAYAQFAGEVMAWKKLMATLLEDLSDVAVTSEFQGEQIAGAVQLYERAMDRANTVLSSYARLRIDDRLAAISKQQADTVMRAIEAVIALFGADRDQATEARRVAARHLRIAA